MLERLLALLILICVSPICLILIILIVLEDGRPVFFTQKRIGKDHTLFKLYKFRTMRTDTPDVATHLLENPDKYVLKTGKILRKLSLDELPNLINILKGQMLFVGPRPALHNQEDLMALRINTGVSKMTPGLTGWAQINGRDEITIEEKVVLEKEYLDRKSLTLDVKIFLITIMAAFIKRRGIKH
tara:strand:- start:1931 stop:2485 length:555 start_codon:yes stop_codon:yes gene_type:complete